MSAHTPRRVKIAIIGAGHSGLCMGMKLKEARIEDFVILEKGATLGGTWRDNTYPGASCDAPSFLYSFSFAQKTDWSRRFAWQSELLAYSAECAIKYGLLPHCRFNTEVSRAAYDDASNTWTLNNKSGRYSKHNTDRTPDQLVNAANLVHEVVDPGTATWGNVYYLLAYAPEPIQEELLKSPKLGYDDEKTKSRPHIIVMAAGAPVIRYEKPFEAKPAETTAVKAADKPADKPAAPADAPKKAKKPKAAINDDPS